MVATSAQRIVGVRFRKVGKLYHFDSSAFPEVELGDYVIVETSRGRQLGQVMGLIPPDRTNLPSIRPIKRMATARDMLMKKLYEAKEVEALIICREAAGETGGLDGVKFIRATYNYDGSVLAFLFTAEESVNTNKLRRKLAQQFRARVEMRRIGTRDAAKLLGEYGACGEPRCCSTHLTDFSPISIKMAKAQGISLNPSEITGMCGRLRCCLLYEYEQYVEARKHLPKRNKRIGTPHGEGKVIDVNPLKGTVTVRIDDTRHEVTQDELIPLDELRALQEKAGQGCAKEGGGVCDCGARVRPSKSEGKQDPPQGRSKRSSGKRRPKRRGSGRKDRRQN
jgi:cell fate regulator YaaT (PSP1 superfamily)